MLQNLRFLLLKKSILKLTFLQKPVIQSISFIYIFISFDIDVSKIIYNINDEVKWEFWNNQFLDDTLVCSNIINPKNIYF